MVDQKAKEMEPVETQTVEIMPPDIENLIYVVRNKQVMQYLRLRSMPNKAIHLL